METCKGAGVAEEAGVAKNRCIFYGLCHILILDMGFRCSIGEVMGKQKKRNKTVEVERFCISMYTFFIMHNHVTSYPHPL